MGFGFGRLGAGAQRPSRFAANIEASSAHVKASGGGERDAPVGCHSWKA